MKTKEMQFNACAPVITWSLVVALDPCKESLAWAKHELKDREQIPLDELVEILLKHDHFEWANWLLTRLMDRRQRVRYAVFAARQVLPIFETKYPADKRPRKAIEAAEEWLKSGKSAAAAAAAAYAAAYDAAHAAARAAAHAAARAAAARAAADAHAAAHAAYADAAYDAADAADAAHDAADAAYGRDSMRRIILNYGIDLLSTP